MRAASFLFLELRVFEKPHRFVLEIPEQAELVHEVWIERKAGWQHQLQKPALAQSENTLTSYRGPAEHNDLSISRAIRVWDACYDTEERVREGNRAPRCCPQCRVGSLGCRKYSQCLIERRRHNNLRINSVEVVSTWRHTRIAR